MRALIALAGSTLVANLACCALTGCLQVPTVERAYDGDVIQGRFVDPEAYAAFLRGAIAEASDLRQEALLEYGAAAKVAPGSPEVWTRIGDVRCQADKRDPLADDALSRALAIEPGYAPAWAARARCALARGDEGSARRAAAQAVELDPGADGANVLLARTARGAAESAVRARLLALTATARDPIVAWDSLAAWATASGDVSLWARAMRELARSAPSRRVSIARAAEDLAGLGEIGEARAVAAAAADAAPDPLPDGQALAARLALDEAIARGDAAAVRARVTRVHLSLEEAASRALLAGDRSLARSLARTVVQADRTARGARLVLAASDGGDLSASAADARSGDASISASTLVAFGVAVVQALPLDKAKDALGRISAEALVRGDDRVERPAVVLVSRGVLPASMLSADGAVELAALRRDPGAPASFEGLDARHEYLALALWHPGAARALELSKRFAGVSGSDPIVGAGAALMQLASRAPIPADAAHSILVRNPADPLLAAMALRLAERVGDHDAARQARRTLTALGGAQSGPGVD